jgi:hypothetical protein
MSPWKKSLPRRYSRRFNAAPTRKEATSVTVCVAALCDAHTIIAAADRMLTTGDIEHEPEQTKASWITPSTLILVSGDIPLQTEILRQVHAEVVARQDGDNLLAVGDIADLYVQCFNKVRMKRSENAILAPRGLTYDSFYSGQLTISQSVENQLIAEMFDFALPDVSAIVAGRDSTGGHLWLIDRGSFHNLEAVCRDDVGYIAIGIGYHHAQSQMLFARHTRFKSFAETLFLTYLAKKRAEVAPGVGSDTDMYVIHGTNQIKKFDADTIENLEAIYKGVRRQEISAFRRAGAKATKCAAEIGLVAVKLAKDYGPHKAGETLKVDPIRAEWLRDNGYEAAVKKPAKKKGG